MKALGFVVCGALVFFIIYNLIRHLVINHKAKLVGLLRKVPLLPFPLDGITELKPTENQISLIPQARIQVGKDYKTRCLGGSRTAIDKVNDIMKWIVRYNKIVGPDEKIDDLVPKETKMVSYAMEGFKHGRLSHEFEPVDCGLEGSYYTFQMFGDNRIQVTNYVEEGVSYVAGFCIYIEKAHLSGNHYNEKVIENLFESSKKLPPKGNHAQIQKATAPNETTYLFNQCDQKPTQNQYKEGSPVPSEHEEGDTSTIRYCPKLQRKIMSKTKSGVVIHEEWDPQSREMGMKECELCTDVLNNQYPPMYAS